MRDLPDKKQTRREVFKDVPEDVAGYSHFAVKANPDGGWLVSIRKLRAPVEETVVLTKEELAELQDDLVKRGFVLRL